MFIIAALFLLAGLLALRAKFPADKPNTRRLYKIDNRVVASVCFFVGLCLVALAVASR